MFWYVVLNICLHIEVLRPAGTALSEAGASRTLTLELADWMKNVSKQPKELSEPRGVSTELARAEKKAAKLHPPLVFKCF